MEKLCVALSNLLTIDNSNEEKSKVGTRLESVGKVFTELMDVLEKKNIVLFEILFDFDSKFWKHLLNYC